MPDYVFILHYAAAYGNVNDISVHSGISCL